MAPLISLSEHAAFSLIGPCEHRCTTMADSATTAVPTLQVSTAVTDTDHGQIVVLAAWLCFTAGVLLSAVRVYIRWPLNALAGKDDYAYAISFLLAIVQTAVTVNAVKNGFGRTESELDGRQAIDAAKVSPEPSFRSWFTGDDSIKDASRFHRTR